MQELNYIRDKNLRLWVAKYLDTCVPTYFFSVPASSSGRYHPAYTLGEGGLVRHTKAVTQIAEELLKLEQYADLPHDEIITACIIHDTFKHGVVDAGHTVFEHPMIASEKFTDFMAKSHAPVSISQVALISSCVATHMGQWNKSDRSSVVLNKPVRREQEFVHMCDYLASRKNISVKVE